MDGVVKSSFVIAVVAFCLGPLSPLISKAQLQPEAQTSTQVLPRIEEVPSCLEREPPALEVVRAAWNEAGLLQEWDRSRQSRIRWNAWLPKISGGLSKNIGDQSDYRYEPGSPRVDQLHQENGWRWDVGLTLDLPRVVYDPEELQISRESSKRARERMDMATEVLRLYFTRKRLISHGLPAAGSKAALNLSETTAIINSWTGGSFAQSWCEVKP
jgi:hypothetical protein